MSERAELTIRMGRRKRASLVIDVTPGGLLAIGGMVGAILLSTSVVVRTARRGRRAQDLRAADPPRLLPAGSTRD